MRKVAALLVALALIFALVGTIARAVDWTARGWPAPSRVEQYRWLADYAGLEDEVGVLALGHDLDRLPPRLELALYRAFQVLVPARCIEEPIGRDLVLFDGDRDRVRARLHARGYREVRFGAGPYIALASREPLIARPRPRADAPAPRSAVVLGLFALCIGTAGYVVAGSAGIGLGLAFLPLVFALSGLVSDLGGGMGSAGLVVALACLGLLLGLPDRPRRLARGEAIVTAALVVAGLAVGALACGAFPDGGWDAQAMYRTRARWIYLDPDPLAPFRGEGISWRLHPDYPPLVPYGYAGAFFWCGGESWLAAAILPGLAEIGAALFVQRRLGGYRGIAAFVLLAVSGNVWRFVASQECDAPLAAWSLLAWLLATGGSARERLLSAVAVLAVLASKNEGFLHVLVVLSGLLLLHRSGHVSRSAPIVVALACAVGVGLRVLYAQITPPNDLVSLWGLGHFEPGRLLSVSRTFAKHLVAPASFDGVFVLAALGLALIRPIAPRTRVSAAVCAALLSGFAVVFLGTPHDIAWHLRTAAERLIAQTRPFAVLALAGCLPSPAASGVVRPPR